MKHKLTADEVELVEIGRMCKSLRRLSDWRYGSLKWRRAFYHALLMSQCLKNDRCELMRKALDLP